MTTSVVENLNFALARRGLTQRAAQGASPEQVRQLRVEATELATGFSCELEQMTRALTDQQMALSAQVIELWPNDARMRIAAGQISSKTTNFLQGQQQAAKTQFARER